MPIVTRPRPQPLDLHAKYRPHPGQAALHNDPSQNKVLRLGRRWGKSRWALFELLKRYIEALNIPVSPHLIPPWHAWIVVPSFPQGRQTWDEILHFLPKDMIAPSGVKAEDWMIYLRGSPERPWGKIELKSAHLPETLQTVGLDFLWVNEAQDLSNEAFQKLLPTLRSPERQARAVFEGIPATYKDHWFQRAYEVGERGRAGWLAHTATAFENPLLTKKQLDEIEGDRDLVPEAVWRRMYMAEFSEMASYFSNIEACVSGDMLPEPIPGRRYVAGVDIGRKVDATVMCIMDSVDRKLVHWKAYDAGQNWIIQREGINRLYEDWNIEKVVLDATAMGGDMFSQELQSMGHNVEEFVITPSSRDRLLTTLVVATERETIHFPAQPQLLRQLRAFQARKQTSGSYKYEAPPGEHDDWVFALALGLYGCDDAIPASGGRVRLRSRRYLPTQAEAAGGTRLQVVKRMERLRSERMRERWERAGVPL